MNYSKELVRVRNVKEFLNGETSIYEIYNRHLSLNFKVTTNSWKDGYAEVVSIKNVTKDDEGNDIVGDSIEIGEPIKRVGYYYRKHEVILKYHGFYNDPEDEDSTRKTNSPHLNKWTDVTNIMHHNYWDKIERILKNCKQLEPYEEIVIDNRKEKD